MYFMSIATNTVTSSARLPSSGKIAVSLLVGLLMTGCEQKADLPSQPATESDFFATTCAVCHGEKGEGKSELFSPSIAGLPWWYVEVQMKQFRDGHRGVHPEDIPGQQMRAISLSLTDKQISEVAKLVEEMPAILTAAPAEGADLEQGRYRYANECMECHRYNGTGDRVFQSAPLVTLNRDYLIRQMKNYRDGLRGAVPADLYGVKMVQICETMTDEDIVEIVDYIGALAHGDDPRIAWER